MVLVLFVEGLDSWVLFYKSLFDFGVDDEVVLFDFYGLVISCVVCSFCGSVCLLLNIFEDCNIVIVCLLFSYCGFGVYYIVFDCVDIFVVVV